MRTVYLGLCALGIILPMRQFYPFVVAHGLDVALFSEQLFANDISAFFAFDVIVSAIVSVVFMLSEGRRLGMQRAWLPLLGLSVGVSLALPWFLYLRQTHLEAGARNHAS